MVPAYATDRTTGYASTGGPCESSDRPGPSPMAEVLAALESSVAMADQQIDGLLKELNPCLSASGPVAEKTCANGRADAHCHSELVTSLQGLNGRICELAARVAGIRQRIEL